METSPLIGFFILYMNMAKTKTIQADIEAPGLREDIPPRVDEFLRMLARWTVEDMRFKPALKAENTRLEETTCERG
jgi:hypothetical protein